MNLYPLQFKAIYKEKIWGGTKLEKYFNRKIPSAKTGESWEIAAHKNGTSTVINGPLTGVNLDELIYKWPIKMTGSSKLKRDKFPLLIKLLDANKKLSVQVHPDNNYENLSKEESAKTEMWYIIAAEPGAQLIHGFKKGTNQNDIKKALANGNLEKLLNRISVKAGDIFFIPSGTVHGIEEGILLAEIQQSSDTTYRFYDWDRKDKNGHKRPLHIKKALAVTNLKYNKNIKCTPLTYNCTEYKRSYLAACSYFITEKINIKKEYSINTNGDKFYIILCLKGKGTLYHDKKSYSLSTGQTFYLPASLSHINIKGNNEFLLIYLPDSKEDFINNLLAQGFTESEINNLAGINIWDNLLKNR